MTDNLPKQQQPQTIGSLLKAKEKQLAAALPAYMTPNRVMVIAMTEIKRNPKLKDCTPESFVGAIIQSCQLGLMPDSLTGEAYLVPFRNTKNGGRMECQLIPGYLGLCKLAYQSGQITNIFANVVRQNDEFQFQYGTNTILNHKPTLDERGDVIAYYSYAVLSNGTIQFEVMSLKDMQEHKTHSKAGSGTYSPWNTSFDAMAKKTVIKKVLKFLPKSTENTALSTAIATDEKGDVGIQDNAKIYDMVIKEEPEKSRADQLATALDKKTGELEEPEYGIN